jgi:hypothetical protein
MHVSVLKFRTKRCPGSFFNCPIALLLPHRFKLAFCGRLANGRSRISGFGSTDLLTLVELVNVVNGLSGSKTEVFEGVCKLGWWPVILNCVVDKFLACRDSVIESCTNWS